MLIRRCDRPGCNREFGAPSKPKNMWEKAGAAINALAAEIKGKDTSKLILFRIKSERDGQMHQVDLCPTCEAELAKWFESGGDSSE